MFAECGFKWECLIGKGEGGMSSLCFPRVHWCTLNVHAGLINGERWEDLWEFTIRSPFISAESWFRDVVCIELPGEEEERRKAGMSPTVVWAFLTRHAKRNISYILWLYLTYPTVKELLQRRHNLEGYSVHVIQANQPDSSWLVSTGSYSYLLAWAATAATQDWPVASVYAPQCLTKVLQKASQRVKWKHVQQEKPWVHIFFVKIIIQLW